MLQIQKDRERMFDGYRVLRNQTEVFLRRMLI